MGHVSVERPKAGSLGLLSFGGLAGVLSWCMAGALLVAGPGWSDDAAKPDASAKEVKSDASKDANADTAWQNRWYFFWGPANVHAKLRESEAEINHQLNDVFGRVIPNWDRPQTFKDWSRDFKLWDLHAGVGRDINEYLSWFVDVGGIVGTVKNHDSYRVLGIPLKTRINFSRTLWFVAAGMDYYPWGKPCLARSTAANAFLRCLLASRPYLELAAGHVHVREIADANFYVPHTALKLSQYQRQYHDVNYISPRIGVETPVGKNDSVLLQVGYLFFDRHTTDFNNLSIYFLHHHKF